MGKDNQILALLNAKMRVILCDNRTFLGTFAAYDKYMNVVLTDAMEVKKYKPRRKPLVEGKKDLGTVIVRGENIMSIIVDKEVSDWKVLVNVHAFRITQENVGKREYSFPIYRHEIFWQISGNQQISYFEEIRE